MYIYFAQIQGYLLMIKAVYCMKITAGADASVVSKLHNIASFYTHIMLYLLSTTSEFMAVNLWGRGRSPEAKDGLRLP